MQEGGGGGGSDAAINLSGSDCTRCATYLIIILIIFLMNISSESNLYRVPNRLGYILTKTVAVPEH